VPSFWVEPGDTAGDQLVLRGDEVHHLTVRRRRPGDELDVIDGQGQFFRVRLRSLEGGVSEAHCDILSRHRDRGESPVELHLAPSLIKGQRFDFVVEKATEIGVAYIDPMITFRGVVSGPSDNKLDRWQRLARAAAKQCGRSRVPRLGVPASFEAVVARYQQTCARVLMAVPDGGQGKLARLLGGGERALAAGGGVGLLIGPEGGFTEEETMWAVAAGVSLFSWGPRTMRSDTSAVVLAAMVLDAATGNCSPQVGGDSVGV
jgi:16S rRNA (uracil1498-N3)-methyltransferase